MKLTKDNFKKLVLDSDQLWFIDLKLGNICNLKCRSCGSIFSSRWYDDDVRLWGKPLRPRVQFAGRHEEDVWEQMQEHIPHLERIYFAGGEPLIMEEHYQILDLLIIKLKIVTKTYLHLV